MKLRTKLAAVVLLLGFLFCDNRFVHAQLYGNEWIDTTKVHVKIPIHKNNVYRMGYFAVEQYFTDRGFFLNKIPIAQFRMFNMGKQIPIYIHDQNQNQLLDLNEYIEFVGHKLDGNFDNELYESSNWQRNKITSMVSDTNYYFFTFRTTGNPLRYANYINTSPPATSPKAYHIKREEYAPINNYADGFRMLIGASSLYPCRYTAGEGFCGPIFAGSWDSSIVAYSFLLKTPAVDNSGPAPKIECGVVGISSNYSNIDHKIIFNVGPYAGSSRRFYDTSFAGSVPATVKSTLLASDLGASQTEIKLNSLLFTGIGYSSIAFSHAVLEYSKKYNLTDSAVYNYTEDISPNPVNIEWSNYGNGLFTIPVVYDEENLFRIFANYDANTRKIKYTMPATSQPGKIFLEDEGKFENLSNIDCRGVIIRGYTEQLNAERSYLMITSKSLLSSPKDEVLNYKGIWDTRYNVFLTTVEDLYNTFSYGIPHPLAIRHYAKFLLENSPVYKPKCMLLIGRGFDMSYNRGNKLQQMQPYISYNHVPTFGVPASDNLFTAGLDGTQTEPAIPTGRIPADKPEDVSNYRDKVIDYLFANANYEDWQKNVLHLSGGATSDQAISIALKLKYMEQFPLENPFAGKVYSYSKSASGGVDVNFRTSITNKINNGVNLVTFLGHGSTSVTDIDVGDPNSYLNTGKYPIFYFNGCQIGNPCVPSSVVSSGLGERTFKVKKKGAIAFIGQTSISELYTVSAQMQNVYRRYFDSTIDPEIGYKSLGMVLKSGIKDFQYPSSLLNVFHSDELLLQGDPALPVYNPNLPDLVVKGGAIFLDPPNTIALQDSFRVGVIMFNSGKGVNDSFNIDLGRLYPDGVTKRNFQIRWKMNGFTDTAYFVIRSKDIATKGENVFTVQLNAEHNPTEYRYDNNSTTSKFNLAANGVNLIYPPRFAIVGSDSVEFIVQKSDLFKEAEDFYIELDTTPWFSSPLLNSLEKKGMPLTSGAIAKWKVKLPSLRDTQTYFWRARISAPRDAGGDWIMHSFTYIKNHDEGWMQNIYWQYQNLTSRNVFGNITADSANNAMRFSHILKKIYIDCAYNQTSNLGVKESGFSGQDLNYGVCTGAGIVCIPWDGKTLERKPVDTSKIQPTCQWGRAWKTFGNQDDYQLYYAFDLGDLNEQARFIKFVDAMEDSMFVTIYSRRVMHAEALTPQCRLALNKIGSSMFDTAKWRQDDVMWVALGRKGWTPGKAQETTTYGRAFAYVGIEANMIGDATKGFMYSEKIGPTNEFKELIFNPVWNSDGKPGDELYIDVVGYKADGSEDKLRPGEGKSPVSLTSIDTKKYKFIGLKMYSFDGINSTSPNMVNWRITHDPVPEGTLFPDLLAQYRFHEDTIYEGDTFLLHLPFKNISKVKFRDSILFEYSVYNKLTRQELDKGVLRFHALGPDSSFYFHYTMPTTGLNGPYAMQISVNPYYEQPEKTLVNNTALLNFYITKDIMNPLLDVTFDGRHIVNGDIVSANPFILISSKDENKFLLQKDTSTFDLMVKKPGSSTFEKIIFGTDALFFAASGKDNRARVEYKPTDLPSGTYILKVQSRDAKQNNAGVAEYEIAFNIVREKSVTHFYPYPNPFTTSMRFVFTLTGTEVPDDIRIKIMTAEGRVVKEVSKEELGNIRVGNNITDWYWDGTDQFGDKLGNGTYFYKVTVKSNGEDLKLRASKGDSSFKDQVGVIYLMR